jgi:hypothetical protein
VSLAEAPPTNRENAMKDINELHKQIVGEITEERNKEVAAFLTAKRETNAAAEKKHAQAMEQFKATGVDLKKYEAFHNALDADNANQLKRIKDKYAAEASASKIIVSEQREIALNAATAPEELRIIPPAYAAIFSTKDKEDKLSGGTGTDVPNYSVIDAWDWASGAGNGWFGSGAGSYQVWVEFGFWYFPTVNRFYSIVPHNLFRGFYIVRSDDGFWDSKYARVVIDIWTNVWQYNWKGWTQNTVLDVGSDNIDVNNRFDTERHTYNSVLLGANDWAYVRNYVSLYVYARGGGSYAELNFAVGNANYLSCPHVHIY